MLKPVPDLNEVGKLEFVLPCWTTVVVTVFVVVLELAITSAITPPAMAPPMIGTHRLTLRMVLVLSWTGLFLSVPYRTTYP
jgi:hypothetical protein